MSDKKETGGIEFAADKDGLKASGTIKPPKHTEEDAQAAWAYAAGGVGAAGIAVAGFPILGGVMLAGVGVTVAVSRISRWFTLDGDKSTITAETPTLPESDDKPLPPTAA